MRWFTSCLNEGLRFAVFVLLAVISVVLFVTMCIVMRPLLMAAFIVAAFGGSVLCSFNPRFRGWVETMG